MPKLKFRSREVSKEYSLYTSRDLKEFYKTRAYSKTGMKGVKIPMQDLGIKTFSMKIQYLF